MLGEPHEAQELNLGGVEPDDDSDQCEPAVGLGSWPRTIELCCSLDFGGDERHEISMLRDLYQRLDSVKCRCVMMWVGRFQEDEASRREIRARLGSAGKESWGVRKRRSQIRRHCLGRGIPQGA